MQMLTHSSRQPSCVLTFCSCTFFRGAIVAIENYDVTVLRGSGQYRSSDVLQLIAKGDSQWEDLVPPTVAKIIRQRGNMKPESNGKPPEPFIPAPEVMG